MKSKNKTEEIIIKAWKNPAFKKKLLQNPKAVFKEEGISLPETVQVRVYEDSPTLINFVLPPTPQHIDEIEEDEIKKIAAGSMSRIENCGPEITL